MAWSDYAGVDSCIVGQRYRFERPPHLAAFRMKWFEEDSLHTAVVDKVSKPIARTFESAYFMGELDECKLFSRDEIPKEILAMEFPKGFFVGQAEEDGGWYAFLAVSNPDEEASGFEIR